MKSIRTKIVLLVMLCLLSTTLIIGGTGIFMLSAVISNNSSQIMNLMCESEASDIDAMLHEIALSVETLAFFAQDRLESVERLKNDPAYADIYAGQLLDVTLSAARNTRGALTFYVRFNPDFTHPTSGLFYSRKSVGGDFDRLPPTDFSLYDPDDVERVGWFYIPAARRRGAWMEPYYNENIHVRMISYVVPIYVGDTLVGVVGMDIDFSVLEQAVKRMTAYQSGYAFLTDAHARVVFHRLIPNGSDLTEYADGEFRGLAARLQNGVNDGGLSSFMHKGKKEQAAFRVLGNDMRLVLIAPENEINERANAMFLLIVVFDVAIVSFFLFTSVVMTNRLIRPLRDLDAAAKKIASGDLGVSIPHQSNDEIGRLSESFRQTAKSLGTHIEYINALAYRDALTGIKNKTAYNESAKHMDDLILVKKPEFAVAVFDVNGLKAVNDTYGHEYGDMLIADASKFICNIFKHSPAYRIGGDEFAVVLENDDYENRDALFRHFEEGLRARSIRIEERGATVPISIAWGIAVYSSEEDESFADVFKRADGEMYRNKREMKSRTA